MMRKVLAIAPVLGWIALAGTLAALAVLLRGGIAAAREPGALETAVARRLRSWLIPSSAQALVNPISRSERVLSEGRAHFADHCASCHGNDGSGETPLGRGLYPRAPDMRLPATQDLTDGELYYIIENGVKLTGMPAWGGGGNPEVTWHLVHFIRHLPSLAPSELEEMEALNPKSPDEWRAAEEDRRFLEGASPSTEPAVKTHHH